MASNKGGPWGGGGGRDNGGDDRRPGGQRPGGGDQPQIPEIDEIVRKGQEQLRVLMGGRGGKRPNGPGGGSGGPGFNRGSITLIVLAAVGLWLWASVYAVKPEEQSVQLFLGEYASTGQPGLNFAPWPVMTYQKVNVTSERVEAIGTGGSGRMSQGLMLTGDENIVDIDFQVVWNITDPAQFLFNLRDPDETVSAVAESAMREIIAQSQLAPILNRDRGAIASRLEELIQGTLSSYGAGINVVRINFDKADPPSEVIDAFRQVQAAEQERDRLEKEADAYANTVLGAARGEAAQLLEEAEGYRARVVNEAEGEASRFTAVLTEYQKAPEVTRQRLYLETMERVLGDVDKILLEGGLGGEGGIVPYLPLNELRRSQTGQGSSN
ncbi:FtsH protease activity modulator HflK [Maritimibacter sp. 55A14]|uniref:FtsH protease activity modulator HflK n=1 Tax=Maritimibacter sp. 55A14 TaxID=2174844 RepID=UPI000D61CAC4|nr:FtsH protease activity modulator HflK [Maritimibacter sp. 55A14]PWE32049.1 FtsH protease activity modulator HflK [Maritimibacter sp. 55A14]